MSVTVNTSSEEIEIGTTGTQLSTQPAPESIGCPTCVPSSQWNTTITNSGCHQWYGSVEILRLLKSREYSERSNGRGCVLLSSGAKIWRRMTRTGIEPAFHSVICDGDILRVELPSTTSLFTLYVRASTYFLPLTPMLCSTENEVNKTSSRWAWIKRGLSSR